LKSGEYHVKSSGSGFRSIDMWLVLAAGLVVLSPQTTAQPPTGIIVGRVVDGASNSPVISAIVTLTGAGMKPQRVMVDGRGRFLFGRLPAGSYTIDATRTGYLDGAYGRVRPDGAGSALELAVGERVVDAVVRLWKFGAISGAVTDDAGDPVQYARVQALRRTVIAGRWRLATTGRSANTDERGQYRIAGLPPGDYALVITAMNATIPSSLLSVAADVKAGNNEIVRSLRGKGTFGYVNDLMQGFPVVRAGDFMLQTSADRVMPVTGDQPIEAYPTVWHPSGASPGTGSIVTVNAGDERTGISSIRDGDRPRRARAAPRIAPGAGSHGQHGRGDHIKSRALDDDGDDRDGRQRHVHIPGGAARVVRPPRGHHAAASPGPAELHRGAHARWHELGRASRTSGASAGVHRSCALGGRLRHRRRG
jgi:hypothetical protein